MDYIFSKEWWKASLTRAIKTFCQTFVAMCGTGALLQEIDWPMVVGASALASLLSVMTSLAGLPEVPEEVRGKHVKIETLPDNYEL